MSKPHRPKLQLWVVVTALAACLMVQVFSQGITIPNTFVNGTTADANQVNADFSALAANALNRNAGTMLGTLTSQHVIPGTDATYDLGASGTKFRDLFLSRNLAVGGTTTLTGAVVSNVIFTDATFDVGAAGANRPRDVFTSRDVTFGRNAVGPAMFAAGNSGAAITLNFATNGALQSVTRNSNCTFTLTAPPSAGFITIKFIHDGTANVYTVTFSPVPKWPGGTAPTFTNTNAAVDVVTLFYDGSTYYGVGQVSFS